MSRKETRYVGVAGAGAASRLLVVRRRLVHHLGRVEEVHELERGLVVRWRLRGASARDLRGLVACRIKHARGAALGARVAGGVLLKRRNVDPAKTRAPFGR